MPMLNVKASGFLHPEISKTNAARTRGADCPSSECAATRMQLPLISFTKINGSWAVRRAQRAGQEERVI
jgi:hypothetical protein